MKGKLLAYIKENLDNFESASFKRSKSINRERASYLSAAKMEDIDSSIGTAALDDLEADYCSIDDYITNNKDGDKFQKLLFKYIDRKNLKDSDVYNKVHLDRRTFAKIRNEEYHPSKETVILLAFSLELNEKELEDLLSSAYYSLPKNNYHDLIIRFCFINKIYDIKEVNELLDDYNCELFNY